ncbi:DUF7281 domain-containing protein [Halomonas getboli]|uniref:DUF7281 domain-containing protein n=1 Tax=Halomonas getboli TaxID=2935862 RepID=UPI001FFF0108|nr:hypothetical protein [Halomonas getboli]MCK2183105.1 hypothetical protein [Halomonas getboli]
MTALSASARRVLRDAAGKLRLEPYVDKTRGKAVAEIVAWCRGWDIEPGARLNRVRLRLDRELLEAIDAELEVQGQPPLVAELSGLTTAEQAEHGQQEAKSVREAPRESRVLVSLPAGASRPGIASGVRECLDVDWRTITLDAFDALVQVENLDSFYAFTAHLPALSAYQRPLVVYRGDRHYGGGFARLAGAWSASGRPHAYAGDFDLKGLDIALASGATELLLPPLVWLRQHATAAHVPASQEPYREWLRRHRATLPETHPLRGYLALLLDEQRGLKQQWFMAPCVTLALRGPA